MFRSEDEIRREDIKADEQRQKIFQTSCNSSVKTIIITFHSHYQEILPLDHLLKMLRHNVVCSKTK